MNNDRSHTLAIQNNFYIESELGFNLDAVPETCQWGGKIVKLKHERLYAEYSRGLVDYILSDEQPRMAGLYTSLAQGEPMPNDAAMGQFWHIMSIALSNIGSGRQPVNTALQAAAARMRQSMR